VYAKKRRGRLLGESGRTLSIRKKGSLNEKRKLNKPQLEGEKKGTVCARSEGRPWKRETTEEEIWWKGIPMPSVASGGPELSKGREKLNQR